ncbi:CHAT domain-containing protein [Irpex rosettiformis]|uniref:CHAT domain-containing protein n=1 Tax=Irpex rosettiformis TaxID=378272 RepID=A0ACB8TNU4_9APHY|nr:CHAT domain-containing protein [Irpex rosettiformis]
MSTSDGAEPHPPASAESSFATSSIQNFSNLPLHAKMWIVAERAYEQYETRGDLDALETSIQCYRVSMGAIEDDHPEKVDIINNLGVILSARFKCVGEHQDLEEAISLHQLANALTPDDSPDKASRLSNLAASILSRFEREGRGEDLEEAIGIWTHAVELVPDSHVDKPTLLNNLGSSHQTRFEQLGKLEDLESAISLHARAVELTPDGHPDKPSWLNNSGNSYLIRFKQLGKREDLESAIALHARAEDLTPDGHPNKPSLLSNSGNPHLTRFQQLGKLEDLESAISLHARAVELTPDGHPDKPSWLNNSGNSHLTRFERLGLIEDLERAIKLYACATELTPDGHPNKPSWLNNLANSLSDRYERTRDLKDLERAAAHQSRAVDLTPDGHPNKPSYLNNLGTKLQTRFEQSRSLDDLDQAIAHKTNAVSLTPEGHPDKPRWLYNLGNSLQERFNEAGNALDLEEAIKCSTCSVELLPKNHAERALMLRLLGELFDTRLYSPHAQADDATRAMEAFLEAVQHPNSHPLERLQACGQYTSLLSKLPHLFTTPLRLTLLNAYKYALGLVPRCIWMGNNMRGRYASEEVLVIRIVVNNAVTAAISAGEYGLALEFLETGRAVVWSQVLQLRTPLDDLRQLHPQLADDLYYVSQALQHAAASPSGSLPLSTEAHKAQPSLKGHAQSSHTHALEYEELITQIRELDGFKDFLLPKTLSQLTGACASGPVVVLNLHNTRCDALVLSQPDHITHIPLPEFSRTHAVKLHKDLWSILAARNLRGRFRDSEWYDDDNRGQDMPGNGVRNDPMFRVLGDLWNFVVKPILDVVTTLPTVTCTTSLPHITWCPTGPLAFLPLHAAGIYRAGRSVETIMDFAVSSYTPTLEALLKPHVQTSSTSDYPRALVVSQPTLQSRNPIPQTTIEAGIVVSLTGLSTDTLHDSDGTVDTVLDGMETHNWVHLACHGLQDQTDPINSFFALYDGKLTLSTLMSKHLPNADLAVLSACQTATGDAKLSEEAVHLAAGMLNIGFKSVIGTMWSISDRSGPIVMAKFYEVLMEQVRAGAELQPAYALHEAMKALRAELGVNKFMEWIPFIHFGL